MRYTQIFKSQFLKNSAILSFGIILAQMVNMIIYPILGRIFTPQDFALLATLTSISSVLVVLSTGKYEMSIVICNDTKQALNTIALCISLCLSEMFVVSIIFSLINTELSILLKEPRLENLWYLAIISTISIVIFNCYNEWCILQRKFKSLSINKISNSFFVASGKVISGFAKISNGLVWGDTLGRVASALGCIYRITSKEKDFRKQISIENIKVTAKRYKNFPKYIMPGQFLNALSMAAPVFMISYYYDNTTTGYFSMALSLLILPVNIISNAIKDVFRQRIVTEIKENRNCRNLMVKLLFPILIISFLLGAIVYPFLPIIFELFVGPQWIKAGLFCQILLVMAITDFIAMAYNGVLIASEKLNIIFYWQILFLLTTILPFIFGGLNNYSIETTLIIFSFSRSLAYIIYVVLSFKYAGNNVK